MATAHITKKRLEVWQSFFFCFALCRYVPCIILRPFSSTARISCVYMDVTTMFSSDTLSFREKISKQHEKKKIDGYCDKFAAKSKYLCPAYKTAQHKFTRYVRTQRIEEKKLDTDEGRGEKNW